MLQSRVTIALALICIAGCGDSSSGPFGAPTPAPIMKPFEGPWRFSLNKTLAQWQAQGVPATEIAEARKLAQSFPLHPDMNITGDTAILPGAIEGEYHFFALHPHNQWVCGKAWHHEDRHDPGDMSKVLARLEIRGGDLLLSLRDHDDAADPNDPEVTNVPTLSGSAATCTADAAPNPPWAPWLTYVFERAGK